MPRFLAVLIAVAAVVVGTVAPLDVATASASVAASASQTRSLSDPAQSSIVKTSLAGFNAGNIISDAVFTNKNTMSEAQIQSFFNSKVSKCVGGSDKWGPIVCLKDFKITSVNRPADAYCSGYKGAANESAARIIYRVAQACNINPQVLIVMLQKEQGLVTHVWPSAYRYDIALGQGCPDTAACDPNYVGFFHQIYGAARQMQIYMEGKYFQWYAPGKTWGILYHPNASCGRGNVHVANKATAALYYYTPYQPNAAALRANYGEGDACSSYGNRNFYNYFTDWFGSTQSAIGRQGLVKVGTAVWLLSGTNRYHITAEAYPEYKPVFGAPTVVASSTLAAYKEGPRGSFFVRNASTGVVAFLSGNKTHRFASCGLVQAWGGACGASLVQLTPALFDKFGAAAEMTAFARLSAGGRIHQLDGDVAYPVYNSTSARALNGGKVPFVAIMPEAARATHTTSKYTRFGPGDFVRIQGDPRVWLADAGNGTLYHLPSWNVAREMALKASTSHVVAASELAGYTKKSSLELLTVCGTATYLPGEGVMSKYSGSAPSGFATAKLDGVNCSALNLKNGSGANKGVFVRAQGTSEVYHAVDGVLRHVPSVSQLIDLNGGVRPVTHLISKKYLATFTIGAPYISSGSIVRFDGAPEVWLIDGNRMVHMPSWALGNEVGWYSPARVAPVAAKKGLVDGGTLSPFVRCEGKIYFLTQGKRVQVDGGALGDYTATDLSSTTCGQIPVSGSVVGRLFVTDSQRTAVYVNSGFLALNDASAISRAGGAAATKVTIGSKLFSWLRTSENVPSDGSAVRADDQVQVTVVDSGRRLHVPNWGVGEDLGMRARYSVVPSALLANLPLSSTEIGIFVACGSTNYVASKGTFYPISASALGGFSTVPLSSATCSTLALSNKPPINKLQLTAGDGTTYSLIGGKLRVSAADTSATVLTVDKRTIGGMPKA